MQTDYVKLKDIESALPSNTQQVPILKSNKEQHNPSLKAVNYASTCHKPLPEISACKAGPVDQSNLGLFYMLLGQFAFATMVICVRALLIMDNALPNLEIQFIRGIIGTIMALAMIWRSKVHPFGPPGYRTMLVARALFGWVSTLTSSFSLVYINAGEASVIQFLVPFTTGILAKIFLNEPWGLIDGMICLAALSGVTISARPWETPDSSSSEYRLFGIALSLISSVFTAICLITIRMLGPKIHVSHNVLYFHLPNIPLAPLMVPILSLMQPTASWRAPGVREMVIIGLSASSGCVGQYLQTKALKLTNVGRASYMGYVQAVFSFLVEWAVWGVVPNWMTILGSLIICGCLVANVVVKRS